MTEAKSEGRIIQFRRGRKTIIEKHFLIEVKGITNKKDAEKLVGKEVEWRSPAGKKINGKISGVHGGKGVVRAIFEKGLPGQAVTTMVAIR
jgi:large subunit ribosomal protein L35Ae